VLVSDSSVHRARLGLFFDMSSGCHWLWLKARHDDTMEDY